VPLQTDTPYPNFKTEANSAATVLETTHVTASAEDRVNPFSLPTHTASMDCPYQSVPSASPSGLDESEGSLEAHHHGPEVSDDGSGPPPEGLAHADARMAGFYHKCRADKLTNLLRELDLTDQRSLEGWLAQPFVLTAYSEVFDSMISKEVGEWKSRHDMGQRPSYNETTSSLTARLSKALNALANTNSRLRLEDADKSGWMKDDHTVRFITQIVVGGRADGACWHQSQGSEHDERLCYKALFLLRWLEWIHHPTGGESVNSVNRETTKRRWRDFLALARSHQSPPSRVDTFVDASIPQGGMLVEEQDSQEVHPLSRISPPREQAPCSSSSAAPCLPREFSSTPLATALPSSPSRGLPRATVTRSTPFEGVLPRIGTTSSLPETVSVLAATALIGASILLPDGVRMPRVQLPGLKLPPLIDSSPPIAPALPSIQQEDPSIKTRLDDSSLGVDQYSRIGRVEIILNSRLGQTQASGAVRHKRGREEVSFPSSNKRTRYEEGTLSSEDRIKPQHSVRISNPRTISAASDTTTMIPTYSLTLSCKLLQQKGAAWLTVMAYKVWQNELTHRLAGWGVNAQYTESCVLVLDGWRRKYPSDMLEESRVLIVDEDVSATSRLVSDLDS
jgi:hypothetical protein